ncbi:MAG: translation initiation factor IF-3, partial [Zetaproteobacteria bacterium CG_4_8_14_3_um_filter_59_5]
MPVNYEIQAPKVRVIGSDGEQVGVLSLKDAIAQ